MSKTKTPHRLNFPEKEVIDKPGKVAYVPFVTDDGRVGYHVQRKDGAETFIYFNPTTDSSGCDSPDVFVYIGKANDPNEDEPQHFYNFTDEEFAA